PDGVPGGTLRPPHFNFTDSFWRENRDPYSRSTCRSHYTRQAGLAGSSSHRYPSHVVKSAGNAVGDRANWIGKVDHALCRTQSTTVARAEYHHSGRSGGIQAGGSEPGPGPTKCRHMYSRAP